MSALTPPVPSDSDSGAVERLLVNVVRMLAFYAEYEPTRRRDYHTAIASELAVAAESCKDAPWLRLDGVRKAIDHTRARWASMTPEAAAVTYRYKDVANVIRGLLMVVRAHQGDPVEGRGVGHP